MNNKNQLTMIILSVVLSVFYANGRYVFNVRNKNNTLKSRLKAEKLSKFKVNNKDIRCHLTSVTFAVSPF